MAMTTDEKYMKHALELAARAVGRTSPNPLVGAVLVKNGKIIGEGWHHKAGTPHAEIHALTSAGDAAAGATLYVTLEPCSHYGRTGPCADAVIKAGVSRVVAAMADPNPLVAGQGLEKLRQAGIDVEVGVLRDEATVLNEVFLKWISNKMPFTVLKSAMTLDGRIASYTGDSKWVTSASARREGHRLRDRYDAIMVGIGTVLADDPALTTRLGDGSRNPVRIIVDSKARIPLNAKVLTDGQAHTIVAVTHRAAADNIKAIQSSGAEAMIVPEGPDGVDLDKLFSILGQRGITSILVEGGAKLNASCLAAGLIDKVCWFIAPKIIGGKEAPGPIGGAGVARMADALQLERMQVQCIVNDIMVTAYVHR